MVPLAFFKALGYPRYLERLVTQMKGLLQAKVVGHWGKVEYNYGSLLAF